MMAPRAMKSIVNDNKLPRGWKLIPLTLSHHSKPEKHLKMVKLGLPVRVWEKTLHWTFSFWLMLLLNHQIHCIFLFHMFPTCKYVFIFAYLWILNGSTMAVLITRCCSTPPLNKWESRWSRCCPMRYSPKAPINAWGATSWTTPKSTWLLSRNLFPTTWRRNWHWPRNCLCLLRELESVCQG